MEEDALKYTSGYNIGFTLGMNAEFEGNALMIEEMWQTCTKNPDDPYFLGFIKGHDEAMYNLSKERKDELSNIVLEKSKNSPERGR